MRPGRGSPRPGPTPSGGSGGVLPPRPVELLGRGLGPDKTKVLSAIVGWEVVSKDSCGNFDLPLETPLRSLASGVVLCSCLGWASPRDETESVLDVPEAIFKNDLLVDGPASRLSSDR